MPLNCVPLVPGMWGSASGSDLRAIYRRRKQDNWGVPLLDADGREQWDLTGPLPLRRHEDYVAKGFEYVTLADEQSLVDAAKHLAAAGYDWRTYANQDRRTRSPFSQALYLEDARSNQERALEELRQLVEQYGADAVVAIKRKDNPHFVLPAELTSPDADEATVAVRRRGRPRKDGALAS